MFAVLAHFAATHMTTSYRGLLYVRKRRRDERACVRCSPAKQLRVDGAFLLRPLDADAGHAAALVELVRLQLVIQLACSVAFPAEANQTIPSRRCCTGINERRR